jgi:hypothetical protein
VKSARLWVIAILLSILVVPASALSFSTQDSSFVSNLGALIRDDLSDSSTLPESWDELEKRYPSYGDKPWKPKDRYAFLPEGSRPQIRRQYDGELFFLSRKPFRDVTFKQTLVFPRVKTLTNPQRYGLVRYRTNHIAKVVFSEEEVQHLFRSQNIPLPTPDDLPEREWVKSLQRREALFRSSAILVLIFGALVFLRKLRTMIPTLRGLQ